MRPSRIDMVRIEEHRRNSSLDRRYSDPTSSTYTRRSKSFPRSKDETRIVHPSHLYEQKVQTKLFNDLGIYKPGQILKNSWGNISYAQIICYAINTSIWRRMTLNEICQWISTNVPYFRTRTDPKSSWGWKNSIRHNLSLHSKFVRVPLINKKDLDGKSNMLRASGIKYVWTVQEGEEKPVSPYKKYASARKKKRQRIEANEALKNALATSYPENFGSVHQSASANSHKYLGWLPPQQQNQQSTQNTTLSRSDVRILSFVSSRTPSTVNDERTNICNSNRINEDVKPPVMDSSYMQFLNKRKSSVDLVYTQKKPKHFSPPPHQNQPKLFPFPKIGQPTQPTQQSTQSQTTNISFDSMIRSFLGRS